MESDINEHTLITAERKRCSDIKLIDALGGLKPKQKQPHTVTMNQKTHDECLSGVPKASADAPCMAMGLRLVANPFLLDGQYAVFDSKGELVYAGWVDGRESKESTNGN